MVCNSYIFRHSARVTHYIYRMLTSCGLLVSLRSAYSNSALRASFGKLRFPKIVALWAKIISPQAPFVRILCYQTIRKQTRGHIRLNRLEFCSNKIVLHGRNWELRTNLTPLDLVAEAQHFTGERKHKKKGKNDPYADVGPFSHWHRRCYSYAYVHAHVASETRLTSNM